MAKTKQERIESIQTEIKQLENQKKKLLKEQKEKARKDRTRCLIERGAILESLINEADKLTGEQIKTFLEKTIQTKFARDILTNIRVQSEEAAARKPEESDKLAG